MYWHSYAKLCAPYAIRQFLLRNTNLIGESIVQKLEGPFLIFPSQLVRHQSSRLGPILPATVTLVGATRPMINDQPRLHLGYHHPAAPDLLVLRYGYSR